MAESVHKQCMDAIASAIQGLSLEQLSRDEIVVRRRAFPDGMVHYGISIHPSEEQEAPGTNSREDIGYGVDVTMAAPADNSMRDSVDLIPSWREAIRRKLMHDRLSVTLTGGHYLQTKVEHGTFNAPLPKDSHEYELSRLVVRCWMREPRT